MDSVIWIELDADERIVGHHDAFWGRPLESQSAAGWKGRRAKVAAVP